MEGSCSTGQSPQRAAVPVEEEEEEEEEEDFCSLCFVSKGCFNLEGNKKLFHKTHVGHTEVSLPS
jgi:hypothetical protein